MAQYWHCHVEVKTQTSTLISNDELDTMSEVNNWLNSMAQPTWNTEKVIVRLTRKTRNDD